MHSIGVVLYSFISLQNNSDVLKVLPINTGMLHFSEKA